mgnify:CR=1 FL=1
MRSKIAELQKRIANLPESDQKQAIVKKLAKISKLAGVDAEDFSKYNPTSDPKYTEWIETEVQAGRLHLGRTVPQRTSGLAIPQPDAPIPSEIPGQL